MNLSQAWKAVLLQAVIALGGSEMKLFMIQHKRVGLFLIWACIGILFPAVVLAFTPGDVFEYDALGRVTKTSHADNTSISYSYPGSTVTVTNERGIATTYQYQSF